MATQDALSVYIELNVSYRLTVEDTVAMPTSETRVSEGGVGDGLRCGQPASCGS